MREQGVLEQVETEVARTFATAAAAAAATVLYVADVNPLMTEAGSVTVDINGGSYTATPTADEFAPFITIAPPLAGPVAEDDPVTVVPAAEVKWAWVSAPGADDLGEPKRCRVPYNLKAYSTLSDGPKNGDERISVIVETEPEPVLVDVPNEPTLLDAGALDPATTVPPGALTDGEPPADAPTDVATVGGLNLIFVKWTPVINPDPVKYDVHVSALEGFTPDATTLLVEGASGSMVAVKTLPNGTPLAYGTTYYFRVVATDADGPGPASAEVSGQMNRTGNADIAVGSITADKLEAILILVTKIATALGGQRIEIDTDGIRSYDPSGDLLVDWSSSTGLMTWKSSADGERVELDQNGLSTYTDSAVMVHFDEAGQSSAAARGDIYFGCTQSSILLRYDKDTFAKTNVAAGGFTVSPIAVNATHVFAVDTINSDIRKFTHAGASVGSGFPIVGTFTDVAADDTTVFAIDGSSDIRKYSATTGVENTSGFPIAGTFTKIAVNSTHIFALQGGDVFKYDKTTGALVSGGFVRPGSAFDSVAADDTYVYVGSSADRYILRYTTAGAPAWSSGGFPILDAVADIAVGNDHLLAMSTTIGGLSFYNVSDAAESARLDATTGLLTGPGIDVVRVGAAVVKSKFVQSDTVQGEIKTTKISSPDFVSPIVVTGDVEVQFGDLTVDGALTADGVASLPRLGHSDQKTISTSVNTTTTSNVSIPDLDMTVTVTGPNDVVWVELDATVRILTAGTISIIELVVDGSGPTGPSLTTEIVGATGRVAGHKKWRLTGLSAGSHTIAFRARNNAASQSAQIQSTHSTAQYWTTT